MAVRRYGGGHFVAVLAFLTALPPYRLIAQCPDGSPPPCRPAPAPAALDSNLIAILPFRVTGADPSLAYLRDGMVDLLAAILSGDDGLRAVDPAAILNALRRAGVMERVPVSPDVARRIARGLGAAQFVSGATVGDARRLTLTASLIQAASGRTRVPVVHVDGPADSLPALVEQLGARLLARRAGESQQRATALGTTSLAAVQAYLRGRAAYRRAAWEEAARQFDAALGHDSAFALAGLGLARAGGWIGIDPAMIDRGRRAAWLGRERLSTADRALVTALLGRRYPATRWADEEVRDWQEAVLRAPDDAEAWHHLGDMFFHWHTVLDIPDWQRRSGEAFRYALALDSLSGSGVEAGSLEHAIDLAALARDTVALWRFGAMGTADSTYARWLLGHIAHDSVALAGMRPLLLEAPTYRLINLTAAIVAFGVGLGDLDPLLATLRARQTPSEFPGVLSTVELNRGHPSRVAALTPPEQRGRLVRDALYGDGDGAAGRRAADELAAVIEGDPPRGDANARDLYLRHTCTVEQWRLAHGDTLTVARAIARLRVAAESLDADATVVVSTICVAMLEAALAVARDAPDAAARVAAFDSLMRRGPPGSLSFLAGANLVVARLHEARGDLPRALAAARRTGFFGGVPHYLSTYLREEGRLAALVADTAGAVRAYRHYLALRADPEPTLVPQRDSVLAELARLEQR